MVGFDKLHELERLGARVAVCTIVRTRGSVPRHAGSRMVVHADGRIEGSVGGGEMESRVIRDALRVLDQGVPELVKYRMVDPQSGDPGVCGGELEVFVEPLRGRPVLVVIGGGHVGAALVHLGRWLGFRVVLSDDRPEFCSPQAAPGADEYLTMTIGELCKRYAFTPDTYVVLPTRGMRLDVEGLPDLLQVPHAYLGVIGSRRRWATAMQELEARGVPRAALEGVHAPMGLELNAETPEEIALSVLAEIVQVRNRGSGQSMRWRGPAEP